MQRLWQHEGLAGYPHQQTYLSQNLHQNATNIPRHHPLYWHSPFPTPSHHHHPFPQLPKNNLVSLFLLTLNSWKFLGGTDSSTIYNIKSGFSSTLSQLPHPAWTYLLHLTNIRIPALSSATPWSQSLLHKTWKREAHVSAQHHFKDFLFDNILGMVQKQYWTILHNRAVKHHTHL